MALGTEVGLGPGDIVLDGDSAPPPKKTWHTPNFRPMSVVAKRLPSQLLLSTCWYSFNKRRILILVVRLQTPVFSCELI